MGIRHDKKVMRDRSGNAEARLRAARPATLEDIEGMNGNPARAGKSEAGRRLATLAGFTSETPEKCLSLGKVPKEKTKHLPSKESTPKGGQRRAHP
jgi:hypothetical protein